MGDSQFRQHAYIRRRGRITAAQERGLELAQSRYAVSNEDHACIAAGARKLGIEIGFGMGQALVHWAQAEPEWLLLGVELYEPGIGSLAHMLHSRAIDNVRIVQQPAQELMQSLPDGVADEVRIYFPDPWPKKRHFKRRLIQAEFLKQLHRVMNKGGVVKLATDWSEYADWMRECFAGVDGFDKVSDEVRREGEHTTTDDRPTTKFERRGEGLGHTIQDLKYQAV